MQLLVSKIFFFIYLIILLNNDFIETKTGRQKGLQQGRGPITISI